MKNKIHIFARGGFFQFYLNLPLEECKRRDNERIAQMCDLEREQESKHELVIQEIEFDDYFYVWVSANADMQEFANMCFKNLSHKNPELLNKS